MSAMLTRRKLIGLAVESTAGSAETVSAADANALVSNIKCSPGDFFGGGERAPAGASSGQRTPTLGPQMGTASFDMDISHTTSAFEIAMQGCGFVLTGSALTPSNAPGDLKTLTIAVWEDGRRKTLRGACGTVSFEFSRDSGRILASFTFSGVWSAPTDVSLPSDPNSIDAPYAFLGSTIQLASADVQLVDSITLDVGAVVEPREDAADATGYAHFYIADIVPTLTLPTEATLVATEDAFGKLLAGTSEALSVVSSDAAGNSITFASAAAMRTQIADGERGAKLLDELTLGLYATDSGNDQLTITRTDAA